MGGIFYEAGKLAIIEVILLIWEGGAKKTEIVYRANLNFQNADIYLQKLIDGGMILVEGKFFKLTPRGAEFLSELHSASAFLD